MDIKELRTYKDSYYDAQDISEKLVKLAAGDENGIEAVKNDLIEAVYELKAMAGNDYNKDYWRTLYNVLLMITERSF